MPREVMMNDKNFDLFDYAQECRRNTLRQKKASSLPLSRNELHQAAFAFLLSLHPTAAAEKVSTRCCKYRAAAGFWRTANSRRKISVAKTVIVVTYETLDSCFTDCADREAKLKSIAALQKRKKILEAKIRREEPELAASDDLFSEFKTWNYAESRNGEYRRLRRQLDKELRVLSQGSRLEKLRQAQVADLCYLAVPRGLIDPAWLLPAWGVVELFPEFPRYRLVREAALQDDVTPAGRTALAINVAVGAAKAARFAAGVDHDGSLRRPPRKRSRLF